MVTLPKTLTPQELAVEFGLKKHQLYYLINHRLPQNCFVRIGRRLRILVEPFSAWLANGGDQGGAA